MHTVLSFPYAEHFKTKEIWECSGKSEDWVCGRKLVAEIQTKLQIKAQAPCLQIRLIECDGFFFSRVQVLLLLQAVFHPPNKSINKSVTQETQGFLCHTETRWVLGAVLFLIWPLMLEEVASRKRDC